MKLHSDTPPTFANKVAASILDVVPEERKLITKWEREEDLDTLATLQMKVLKKNSQLQSEIDAWENDFLFSTGNEPLPDDYTAADMMSAFNRCKISEKLLKYWKISFIR